MLNKLFSNFKPKKHHGKINENTADIILLFLTQPLLFLCFMLPLHGFVLLEIFACSNKKPVICGTEMRL